MLGVQMRWQARGQEQGVLAVFGAECIHGLVEVGEPLHTHDLAEQVKLPVIGFREMMQDDAGSAVQGVPGAKTASKAGPMARRISFGKQVGRDSSTSRPRSWKFCVRRKMSARCAANLYLRALMQALYAVERYVESSG